MKKSEFIKKLNIPKTSMITWLDNYRFAKFFKDKELILSQEFIDEFETYITIKAKKDVRSRQFVQCIDTAKELLLTP